MLFKFDLYLRPRCEEIIKCTNIQIVVFLHSHIWGIHSNALKTFEWFHDFIFQNSPHECRSSFKLQVVSTHTGINERTDMNKWKYYVSMCLALRHSELFIRCGFVILSSWSSKDWCGIKILLPQHAWAWGCWDLQVYLWQHQQFRIFIIFIQIVK